MDVDVTKSPDHTECIRCGMCVRAYHRFGSISLFPVINALLAKPLFHYSLLFLTSKNPAAVREERKVKSEEVKSKNPALSYGIFGGEGGIRTLDTLMGYTRFPIVRARPDYATSPSKIICNYAD